MSAPGTPPPPDTDSLRLRLAESVARACDGAVGASEVLASTESLAALGVGSLALLRLADAVEEEFGVLLDLGDGALHADGFDGLVAQLLRLGAAEPRWAP
ncbi:phosphopantetheine-binding protein [Kitasatospora phosalacinea]|uniref:phosphopantetheine-binding protein n=1 Tax=Kitasatospora phosalacinea TaxID=2065 RepID=UPI0006900466|nr:phosphopantetheine-binding protein [Kitasatospora phosalacinea]